MAPLSTSQPQRRLNDIPQRLAAINYSLLKEQALRKKLGELGISSRGPRAMLEKRHREWLTIWNANCDAARPRSRVELLRDLDVWEKTQGTRAPLNFHVEVRDKNFDTSAWGIRHDTSFKNLIARARGSKRIPATFTEKSPVEDAALTTVESAQPTIPEEKNSMACCSNRSADYGGDRVGRVLGDNTKSGRDPCAGDDTPYTV
jgi:E3 ubiquitin-protein ligase RAD18